jgi:hypothetical protein
MIKYRDKETVTNSTHSLTFVATSFVFLILSERRHGKFCSGPFLSSVNVLKYVWLW